jgi:peptidoglycan/LPS O-acetylase OafA/YrhL
VNDGHVSVFPALTGVRAVAAIAVVATHAAFWTGRYQTDLLGTFLARLDVGVALFFALSGFLLFRPWLVAHFHGATGPSVRRYFWNRAVRILPAYWATVMIAFAVVPSHVGTGAEGIVRSLTLTQVYGGDWQHLGLTQMWSLATEVLFYLLLPVLAVVILSPRRGPWSTRRLLLRCAAVGAISPAWYVVTRTVVDAGASSGFWLPGYIDWFAAGMALSVVAVVWEHDRDRVPAAVHHIAAAPGSAWVLGLCAIAIASTPVAGPPALVPLDLGEALAKNLLYAVAATLLIAPCVFHPAGTPVTAWLNAPVMQWLGKISYEIFLVHLIVLEGVMRLLDQPVFTGNTGATFVLTATLSIPAAWLLFTAVERPTRRLRVLGPGRAREPRLPQSPAGRGPG